MTTNAPQVREHKLLGRDDEPLTILGELLGFATSQRPVHSHAINFTDEEVIEEEINAQEKRLHEITANVRPLTTNENVKNAAVTALERYITDLQEAESPVRYASTGDRCSACRWFEVRIFRVTAEVIDDECNCTGGIAESNYAHEPHCGTVPASGKYLLVTYGLSIVPGEVAKRRFLWTNSAFRVLESLTQRRAGSAFLPATSAQVLAEAAAFDEDLAEAYVNRAVA